MEADSNYASSRISNRNVEKGRATTGYSLGQTRYMFETAWRRSLLGDDGYFNEICFEIITHKIELIRNGFLSYRFTMVSKYIEDSLNILNFHHNIVDTNVIHSRIILSTYPDEPEKNCCQRHLLYKHEDGSYTYE